LSNGRGNGKGGKESFSFQGELHIGKGDKREDWRELVGGEEMGGTRR
jgi:hypothetical protein